MCASIRAHSMRFKLNYIPVAMPEMQTSNDHVVVVEADIQHIQLLHPSIREYTHTQTHAHACCAKNVHACVYVHSEAEADKTT